jgi:copper transport protein
MSAPARRRAAPDPRRAGGPGRTARPQGRRVGWLLARLTLVVATLLLGGAATASAHSTLERSDPPNGGMVSPGRTELTLWFGEPVTKAGSSFSVRPIDLSAPPVAVTPVLDADGTVVHLQTPALERGTFALEWAVVSDDDGHPTRGTVTFGVGFRPDGVPAADSGAPDVGPVALRLADLGGTLLAIGALAVMGRVVTALGAIGTRLRRRILTIGAVGATVSLAAAVANPVLTARNQLGTTDVTVTEWLKAVGDVFVSGSWGVLWAVRLVALAAAVVALWLCRRGERATPATSEPGGSPRRGLDRTAYVAAGALVVSASIDAFAGHASTLPARSTLTAVAAALHVVAAGVWAGALMVLVLTVVPLMRAGRETRRAVMPAAWRAFSPMAAGSSIVLLATGVYEAGRHVESVSTVTRSLYGTAVVAKVLLVAVALGLAGYHTLVVNRGIANRVGRILRLGPDWRPRPRPFTATVAMEAIVLAVAVAVAGLMTSVPTAREVDAAAAVTAPHSDTIDGFFVTFEAVPVGSKSRLVVRAEAVVRPVRSPVTGVEVGIAPGTSTTLTTTDGERITLRAVEPGRYEAATEEPTGGDWTAEVVLHRAGRPDSVVLVPWSSGPGDAPTPTELAASGLAATLLAGLATVVVSWRRRRASGPAPTMGGAGGTVGGAGVGQLPGPRTQTADLSCELPGEQPVEHPVVSADELEEVSRR